MRRLVMVERYWQTRDKNHFLILPVSAPTCYNSFSARTCSIVRVPRYMKGEYLRAPSVSIPKGLSHIEAIEVG